MQTKSLRQAMFLIAFMLGLLLLFIWLGVFRKQVPGSHTVTYRVEGSAAAVVVTYTQKDGVHTQPQDVRLPWEEKVEFTQPATVVLTAGNPSQTGKIQCVLMLDGEVWRREAAKAPDDKVSCAGIVP